jgi:5'-3' exonuclease
VFVFDGKPPEEKRELIYQRKLKKQKAEKEYNEVKNSMIEHDATQNKADVEKMESLKRQFIRINSYHISITKQLLSCFGIQYYDAEGEADELCAKLLANHRVWACLSDDMDMFVYGCSRIIRQVSLLNHTCTLYDMGSILRDLKIDIRTFREIAVLSGSDYNTIEKIHLYKAFKLYGEYKKISVDESFYIWLQQNKYILELDVLQRAYDMFVVSCDDVDTTKYICVMGEQKKDELNKILELDGFLTL